MVTWYTNIYGIIIFLWYLSDQPLLIVHPIWELWHLASHHQPYCLLLQRTTAGPLLKTKGTGRRTTTLCYQTWPDLQLWLQQLYLPVLHCLISHKHACSPCEPSLSGFSFRKPSHDMTFFTLRAYKQNYHIPSADLKRQKEKWDW